MESLSSPSDEIMLKPSEFLTKAMACDVMAVDTETSGGDIRDGRGFCVGISAAVRSNNVYYHSYFPVAHYQDNVATETKELLFQVIASRIIVMHNAKFDLESLATANYPGKFLKWYCTLMMAHFLNENVPKDLDSLSRRLLGNSGKKDNNKFKGMWTMNLGHMIPVAEIEEYAGIDTVRTLQLFYRMYPYFVKSGFDGNQMSELR